MHVSRIESNIKSDKPWSVDLGPRTLILGPNGGGKSAIVQACQLALGGSVTGLMGRGEVKRGDYLMLLGDDAITATATTTAGAATFHAEPGKRPSRTGVEGDTMTLEQVRGFLTASPETACAAIWQRFGRPAERESLLNRLLPSPDEVALRRALALLPKVFSPEQFVTTWKTRASATRALGAFIKQRSEFIEYIIQCLGPDKAPVNDDTVTAAWQAMARSDPAQRAVARDSLFDVLRRQGRQDLYQKAIQEQVEMQHDHTTAKEDVAMLERALRFMALAVLPEVDSAASRYSGLTVSLHPELFVPGIEQDGSIVYALSGSEEARALAGYAGAWFSKVQPMDRPAILVVDDRAYDPKTLALMMKALATVPAQVLVMSVVKPMGRAAQDWTVVEVPL